MAESGWEKFLKYINSKEIGHVITRTQLKAWADLNGLSTGSIDMHRNKLVQVKIWERIARGTYKFVSKLPDGSTTTELDLLYQGDRLKYLENVTTRKEREQVKAERTAVESALRVINEKIISEAISKACLDCKGSFPRVAMALSYRQPQSRQRMLSRMILGETSRLLTEVQKCDTVCMNCHLIRNGPALLA
jgi:hypothetical protein